MLGTVKTIVSKLRPTSADGNEDAGSSRRTALRGDEDTRKGHATDGSGVESSPHLFKCPSCDQVYVADDKRTCSSCRTDVERVEQTY